MITISIKYWFVLICRTQVINHGCSNICTVLIEFSCIYRYKINVKHCLTMLFSPSSLNMIDWICTIVRVETKQPVLQANTCASVYTKKINVQMKTVVTVQDTATTGSKLYAPTKD